MIPCHPVPDGSSEGQAAVSPRPSVVDVFRRYGQAYLDTRTLSPDQARLFRDIMRCRTAELGGHLWKCSGCGFEQPHYNSCRNRGCPNCQALAQARWIAARELQLLPVGHHHVVFTLPSQLRRLVRRHPRLLYNLLFTAAKETLAELARDILGAKLGVTAVLHTWTRELNFHPHIHCVVTAGGLSLDGTRWVERTEFLFPSARMKALFRARILAGLQRMRDAGELTLPDEDNTPDPRAWARFMRRLPPKQKWVVYVEAPFGRSTHVIKYLGRYTHRIGISDQRLISVDGTGVCFRTRKGAVTTLAPFVFIKRFLQHVLPKSFHKIRHFGLYSSVHSKLGLPRARELLQGADPVHHPPEPEPGAEETLDWLETLALLIQEEAPICPQCGAWILTRHELPKRDPGVPQTAQRPERPP